MVLRKESLDGWQNNPPLIRTVIVERRPCKFFYGNDKIVLITITPLVFSPKIDMKLGSWRFTRKPFWQ